MSILSDHRKRRTPWHLWVVGVLSLLWNAVGAMDYVMTQTRNEQYMSQFSQEQLDFFYSFPTWVVACWAIAVWGAVLGSVFLLLRRRLAVWLFFFSFLAMLATMVRNYLFADGLEVVGDPLSLGLSAAVVVIGFALFLYAGIMNRRNILR
jgi:hypothetical protein